MAFTPGTQTNVKSTGADTSFSHTVPAGTHRLLVLLHTKGLSSNPTFSPTYDGVAMTQAEQLVGTAPTHIVTIWYLIDPPAGAHTVATTHGSTTSNRFVAMSWGCDDTPAFDAGASTTLQASVDADDMADITITPNQAASLIVDVMSVNATSGADARGPSQTNIIDIDEGAYNTCTSYAPGMAASAHSIWHRHSFWGGSATYLAAAAVFYEAPSTADGTLTATAAGASTSDAGAATFAATAFLTATGAGVSTSQAEAAVLGASHALTATAAGASASDAGAAAMSATAFLTATAAGASTSDAGAAAFTATAFLTATAAGASTSEAGAAALESSNPADLTATSAGASTSEAGAAVFAAEAILAATSAGASTSAAGQADLIAELAGIILATAAGVSTSEAGAATITASAPFPDRFLPRARVGTRRLASGRGIVGTRQPVAAIGTGGTVVTGGSIG